MAQDASRAVARQRSGDSDARPGDAKLALQAAVALDAVSREATAIVYYQRALAGQLDAEDEVFATVCLVSSYRNLRRYEEAEEWLGKATRKFPGDPVLESFRALVAFDSGKPQRAVYILGQVVLALGADRMDKRYIDILRSKFRGVSNRPYRG